MAEEAVASLRRCTKCKGDKPSTVEFFPRQKSRLSSWCRACHYDQASERRSRIIASGDRRYHEQAKLKRARHGDRYNAGRRERRKSLLEAERKAKTRLAYLQSDKGKRREAMQRWRSSHPLRCAIMNRLNQANRRAAGAKKVTADQVELLLARQSGRCAYCQTELTDFHIDHVVPLSRGGLHELSNLAVACPGCNLSKGAKTLAEWRDTPT